MQLASRIPKRGGGLQALGNSLQRRGLQVLKDVGRAVPRARGHSCTKARRKLQ
jgi:hypothetical protein